MNKPKTSLYVVLEPGNGRPITLARIRDRRFLIEAARCAISESQALAGRKGDSVVAELHRGECDRLRRALSLAIPELRCGPTLLQ